MSTRTGSASGQSVIICSLIGCVHKLDPVDLVFEPAVRKLLEINLPVSGSVFTNAWLSTGLLTKRSYSRVGWFGW